MNNNQPNTDGSIFWDIGAALDDISVQLHQVQNMLQIYDEHIESELQFVREHDGGGGVSYFINRYDMLRSILEVTQLYVLNISKDLKRQVNAAYTAHKATKQESI